MKSDTAIKSSLVVKSPSAGGRGLKCRLGRGVQGLPVVALRGRAWIEIWCRPNYLQRQRVALRGRAWIEMNNLPNVVSSTDVALRGRAWIEMNNLPNVVSSTDVALRGRAWIEIEKQVRKPIGNPSPSAGGRGLKLLLLLRQSLNMQVALRGRAWIEIGRWRS